MTTPPVELLSPILRSIERRQDRRSASVILRLQADGRACTIEMVEPRWLSDMAEMTDATLRAAFSDECRQLKLFCQEPACDPPSRGRIEFWGDVGFLTSIYAHSLVVRRD